MGGVYVLLVSPVISVPPVFERVVLEYHWYSSVPLSSGSSAATVNAATVSPEKYTAPEGWLVMTGASATVLGITWRWAGSLKRNDVRRPGAKKLVLITLTK